MKPAPFEYRRPASLEEALACLQELGDDAKVLAGGQSLVPVMAMRLARPSALVDINRIPELARIDVNGLVEIGSGVYQRDASATPRYIDMRRSITEALTYVGHPQIRNRGTLCGSVAHADPAAEMPAAMCALDAEFVVQRAGASRTVSAHDFFTGYFTTVLAADEVLTAVRIPLQTGPVGSCYQEVSRRHGDFALIGAGVLVRTGDDGATVTEARVALSGAGSVPIRARLAEGVVRGGAVSAELWRAAGAEAAREIDPPADLQASAELRRRLTAALVASALEEAHRRAGRLS